ncbi:AER047Cp [Eremothecium gossypii ATCC 10895]|uniref:Elongator complex protein 1 n=1 Tax=Eremothecium gossypii (strain ATCC 10895 / CBS 109.51 / FGSC 9923 / NRRL Y-1056) TaxID=284811 RepID=Q757G6_EREGS|nr:AER047Cp [Eremothecium gossypii ATCC 10895]AAS52731.2 AER047Cp [Eremothecium gossypii ATCC 10895]
MRNLVSLNKGSLQPSSEAHPNLGLYASCFDTLSDSVTCVLGAADVGAIVVHQYMKSGAVRELASFFTQDYEDELVSFAHFADVNQLVFVFAHGDIMMATYGDEGAGLDATVVEIVGSIEDGIAAAEWSHDEETLALVTGGRSVVLLSRQFEPVADIGLELDDLKLSKNVTVGWGKKETQFRGKGARAMEREALQSLKASGLVGNELRDPTMPYMVDSGAITELDPRTVGISWRGDCEYFVVSTIETVQDPDDDSATLERRALRVYSRHGKLDSASEPVDGLEHALAWRPQGSLIASIQRKVNVPGNESLDLVFFERNGLRHGEFETRLAIDERIKSLAWNASSDILSIALEDRIQLWTSKNYHWYLKQELYTECTKFVKWHPEKDFTLMYGDGDTVNVVDFAYKMIRGPTFEPNDCGMTVVIDGRTVNITPFAMANVPPPLSYRDFDAPDNVLDAAVGLSNTVFAAVTREALVVASIESLANMKSGRHPIIASTFQKHLFATELDTIRQVAFINDSVVGILLDSGQLSRIALVNIQDPIQPELIKVVDTYTKVVLVKSSFDYSTLVYETRDGTVVQLDAEGGTVEITKFPQLVNDFCVKRILTDGKTEWQPAESKLVAFGLTSSGKLYADSVQLASAVISMDITDELLLFTSAQHYLQFVHLNTPEFKPLPTLEGDIMDERIRSIERGSILINIIPSKAAVVLQAPRGNVETIYPRIMVLAEVRKYIGLKRYKDAFVICRTHRIHLDILHDYAPDLFYANLKTFVDDIERVDYLDLFISCLVEEDVTVTKYKETLNMSTDAVFDVAPPPPTEMEEYIKKKSFNPLKSKVNKICQVLLEVLLGTAQYKAKYLQTIVTCYACQNPPKVKDALALISQLRDEEAKDSTVTYLCFLQDVLFVYKEALALYDVNMALLVAQKSQMDPREYLPFLQNLNEQEPLRRKFMIDDHLKNYEMALTHLVGIDEPTGAVSDETREYIQQHELYKKALDLYRYNTQLQNSVYAIYGAHLASKQEYNEAGIIYELLGNWEKAMEVFTMGNKWSPALAIASQHFPDRVLDIATELVDSLQYEHRYAEAAHVELKFMKNVRSAVSLYCKAYDYEQGILLCITEGTPELINELVDPALGDGFSVLAELLADCKGQINSQLRRLRELRAKKEEDPYAFYGQETEEADDVSIAASETSTKESFFTRYTGKTGGTAKTGASRRTAKNKRREERKRARGKKGTIYEEEYLVKSIGRLIDRLKQTLPDGVKLVDALLRRNMREQAYQVQKGFVSMEALLKANIVEIYNISEKDRERIDDNGNVYQLPVIPVPEIPAFPVRQIIDY